LNLNPDFLKDGGFRYEYSGHSYIELTKSKYYTFRGFIAREKYGKKFKSEKKIERIKKLKNQFWGPALVIANGPSLSKISKNTIQQFSNSKSLFTVNNYLNYTSEPEIISNYHFICDNAYWDSNDPEKVEYRNKIRELQTRNDLVVVQPDYQEDFTGFNTIYIRKNPLTGFLKNIDVTRMNGLPNFTSFYAIATAIYLGYSPVYVAGLDLNYYSFIDYDPDQGWVLKSHHVYDIDSRKKEQWRYRDTLLRILNSNLIQIHYLSLFKKHNVRLVNDLKIHESLEIISTNKFNAIRN